MSSRMLDRVSGTDRWVPGPSGQYRASGCPDPRRTGEAFEPVEARRIAERLKIHYTPRHGNWLHMAEIEIGAVVGQCLNRRLPDRKDIRRKVDT